MKKLFVVVLSIIALGVVFYALDSYIKNGKQDVGESVKDYKNIQYSIDNVSVLLVDGVADTEVIPGSESRTVTRFFGNEVDGDINSDGISDTAFLLTQETGGSGTFYYLVVALKTSAGYQGSNAVFLGDRIAPQNTQIVDGIVVVNYAERKAEEPMTAEPSVGVTRYFQFTQGQLVESQSVASAESAMGIYGYHCEDGTKFSMSPAVDMGTIRIVPATNFEPIPEAVLTKTESSVGAQYENEEITFSAQGETVTLSTALFTTTCSPIQVPDEAPFNFGD